MFCISFSLNGQIEYILRCSLFIIAMSYNSAISEAREILPWHHTGNELVPQWYWFQCITILGHWSGTKQLKAWSLKKCLAL